MQRRKGGRTGQLRSGWLLKRVGGEDPLIIDMTLRNKNMSSMFKLPGIRQSGNRIPKTGAPGFRSFNDERRLLQGRAAVSLKPLTWRQLVSHFIVIANTATSLQPQGCILVL